MPHDEQIRRLFEEIKYTHRFPPREAAVRIKNDLSARGMGRSGALVQKVAEVYLEVAEKVLDEFTDTVISRAGALGLEDDTELHRTIASAHQRFFDEVRSFVNAELRGMSTDYADLGMAMVDAKRGPVWDHLERMIELRKLNIPAPVRTKEREQKFGILLSPAQIPRDFEAWALEAKRLGNPIGLIFVDLDHFKKLNERLTNAKVDQTILPEVQQLLVKLVQGRGEAYRHGGEEFVLLLPNLDAEEARAFAEKLRKTFEEHRFVVDGGVEGVTVSIGVAVWPMAGATYTEVLEAANRAEVEAKKTRNTVVLASK